VFGLIGFVMRELKFNMAPLILGLVLGDLLEKNLTRGLVLSGGSLLPFFTRPVCAVLSPMTILSVLWSIPAVNRSVRAVFARRRP
jgi:putative tricarboxylic transport membrane protein